MTVRAALIPGRVTTLSAHNGKCLLD